MKKMTGVMIRMNNNFGMCKIPMSIFNDNELNAFDKLFYSYLLNKTNNGYEIINTITDGELAEETKTAKSTVFSSLKRLKNNNLVYIEDQDMRKKMIEVRINDEKEFIYIPSIISNNTAILVKDKLFIGYLLHNTNYGNKKCVLNINEEADKLNITKETLLKRLRKFRRSYFINYIKKGDEVSIYIDDDFKNEIDKELGEFKWYHQWQVKKASA